MDEFLGPMKLAGKDGMLYEFLFPGTRWFFVTDTSGYEYASVFADT